jgi:hypothetical protein
MLINVTSEEPEVFGRFKECFCSMTASYRVRLSKPALLWLIRRWPPVGALLFSMLGVLLWLATPLSSDVEEPQAIVRPMIRREARVISLTQPRIEALLESSIASLYQECDTKGCKLAQVQLIGIAAKDSKITPGSVSFTASGSGTYVEVHRALSVILQKNPRLSLDRLALSRRDSAPGMVEFSSDWTRFPD